MNRRLFIVIGLLLSQVAPVLMLYNYYMGTRAQQVNGIQQIKQQLIWVTQEGMSDWVAQTWDKLMIWEMDLVLMDTMADMTALITSLFLGGVFYLKISDANGGAAA